MDINAIINKVKTFISFKNFKVSFTLKTNRADDNIIKENCHLT